MPYLNNQLLDRAGIRHADDQDETQHAYAEPLTGLIQYHSLNSILNEIRLETSIYPDDYLEQIQWSYHWIQDDVFLLQQNQQFNN